MRTIFGLVVVASLLAGCGGSSDGSFAGSTFSGGSFQSSNNNSNPSGNASSLAAEARKQAALQQLDAKFKTLPHLFPDDDNRLLAEYLSTHPDFRSARKVVAGVAVEFFDGEYYFIANGQAYDQAAPAAPQVPPLPPVETLPKSGVSARQVGTQRYLLVNAMQPEDIEYPGITNALTDVYTSLRKINRDFRLVNPYAPLAQDATPGRTSYASMKQAFTNLDLLVWMGHSGGDLDNGIFTLKVPLDPNDPALARGEDGKIDQGAVVRGAHIEYVSFQGGQIRLNYRVETNDFYLMPAFFQRYASFNPGSMIYMGCCDGQHPSASAFKQALRQRGAGYYAGWTLEASFTDLEDTAMAFVDLLGGTNRHFQEYHPGTPPSRSWNWALAVEDLGLTPRNRKAFTGLGIGNYNLDQTFEKGFNPTPCSLISESLDQSDPSHAILAPSIRKVTIDEIDQKLYIDGDFDETQDGSTVRFDGTERTILSWNQTQIVCDVPTNGGGKVVVTSHGVASNEVPVTEWSLQARIQQDLDATYDFQPPSTVAKTLTDRGSTILTGACKIRGDVHGYREKPSGPIIINSPLASERNSSIVNRTGTRVTDNEFRPSGSLIYTHTPNANINGSTTVFLTFEKAGSLLSVTFASFSMRILNGFTVTVAEVPSRTPPTPSFMNDMEALFNPPVSLKVNADYSIELGGTNENFTAIPQSGRPGETVQGGVTRRLDQFTGTPGGAIPDADTAH